MDKDTHVFAASGLRLHDKRKSPVCAPNEKVRTQLVEGFAASIDPYPWRF